MSPALGYAIDDPEAIASFRSDKHWNMAMLMEAVPYTAPPPRYLVPSIRPTALDQDGIGACVAFGAETIKDAQDFVDWGSHLYISGKLPSVAGGPTGAFLAYQWLKQGHRTFPGDGIPTVEGSYPEAVCKLAKAEGLPDKDGKPHKVTAYYAHNLANAADLAFLQSVLMEYGPVQIGIPWAGNWMAAPAGPNFIMPAPGSIAGGHSFALVGWETYGGVVYLTAMNSWGFWGSAQGLFRFPASWLYQAPLGPQIIWKTVDQEDAPVASLAIVDKIARLIDTTIGAQIYKVDGTTPLAKVSSGNLGIASSAALSGGFFAVIVSVGGILQLGAIRAADCTNVRVQGGDTTAAELAGRQSEWDRIVPSVTAILPPRP